MTRHQISKAIVTVLLAASPLLVFSLSGGGPPPPSNQLMGFIETDLTLTASSPGPIYDVIGDVVVNPGVTLTIDPGVTLRFTANSDFLGGGTYPDRVELSVFGIMNAGSTAGDSVHFVGSAGTGAEWGEIRIESGGHGSLHTIDVRHAITALRVEGSASVSQASLESWGSGFCVESTGTLTLQYTDIVDNGGGVRSSGSLWIHDCTIADADTGVSSRGELSIAASTISEGEVGVSAIGGPILIDNVSVSEVRYGIRAAGAFGAIRECTVSGAEFTYPEDVGIEIGSGIDTTPSDTLAPEPIIITGFPIGVKLEGPNATVRNILAYDNGYAIMGIGGPHLVNYCTLVDNFSGLRFIWPSPRGTVLNSIAVGGEVGFEMFESPSLVNHSNAWDNYSINYQVPDGTLGPRSAAFDPSFVDRLGGDYHLGPASLFLNYSTGGGEIGAYGPGPGTTSQVHTMTWGHLKNKYR